MPNWCETVATIRGNKEHIKKLIAECFDENGLDFNKIIPEPTEEDFKAGRYLEYYLEDASDRSLMPAKHNPHFNWYDFHCDKWGTKWDACDSSYTYYEDGDLGEISMFFDTAWSPATGIFEELVRKYGDDIELFFGFREPGMDFAGYYDNTGLAWIDTDNKEEWTNFMIDYMGYSIRDAEEEWRYMHDEDDEDIGE